MAESEYDRVKKRAYEIWEEEGRPWGRDAFHWERANQEVVEQFDAAPPVSVASIEEPATSLGDEAINVEMLKSPAKRRVKKAG